MLFSCPANGLADWHICNALFYLLMIHIISNICSALGAVGVVLIEHVEAFILRPVLRSSIITL